MAYSVCIKVLVLGDSGVGKSSLVLQYTEDAFPGSHPTTIMLDIRQRELELPDGKTVRLQFWDTLGQERFNSVASSMYRGAHVVVLVYDVTQPSTFAAFRTRWLTNIQLHCPNAILLLLGNKRDDLEVPPAVPTEDAVEFAQSINASFFETSALTAYNVTRAFDLVAHQYLADNFHFLQPRRGTHVVKLAPPKQTVPVLYPGFDTPQNDDEPTTTCKCF